MAQVSIKDLLEAGVHFGHQTKRWNPRMSKFIFGEKSGIYIIDLEKTLKQINDISNFLNDLTSRGEYVLFVGTKKQAQDIICEAATRCGMFYVNSRWLGGTLTNFNTIRKGVERLKELEAARESGQWEKLSKKEVARLTRETARLQKNFSGIKEMDKRPAALFVIDSKRERTAVNEAVRLSLPIVALVDTDSDPDQITHIIPGNDDAIRSIKLLCSIVADAILAGRKKFAEGKGGGEKESKTSTKPGAEGDK